MLNKLNKLITKIFITSPLQSSKKTCAEVQRASRWRVDAPCSHPYGHRGGKKRHRGTTEGQGRILSKTNLHNL